MLFDFFSPKHNNNQMQSSRKVKCSLSEAPHVFGVFISGPEGWNGQGTQVKPSFEMIKTGKVKRQTKYFTILNFFSLPSFIFV